MSAASDLRESACNRWAHSLSVEVVGRLVEDDNVRSSPGGGTEDDLDLLTARETAHGVVRHELGFETKVGKVRLDLLADERAHETESLRLLGVERLDLCVRVRSL